LPFVAIQNREIADAQIRHVAPFGVGDYSAYLDPIDRNPERWLLSRILALSRPLCHVEQSGREHCRSRAEAT